MANKKRKAYEIVRTSDLSSVYVLATNPGNALELYLSNIGIVPEKGERLNIYRYCNLLIYVDKRGGKEVVYYLQIEKGEEEEKGDKDSRAIAPSRNEKE